MSNNETAAMRKVRKILRNYGLKWPDDEWVEDLALELVAAIRTAALEEAAVLTEELAGTWAEETGLETLMFASDDVTAVGIVENVILAHAAYIRAAKGDKE